MRRAIDVVVAVVFIAVIAPLALIIGFSVLVLSGRPVLYRQLRSGIGGSQFWIVKFRSMEPALYDDQPDIERQTRFGEFLRATALDEIPQLWNILIGAMSFIGPRPGAPSQVALYDVRQLGRLAIAPGLTGWAQVNGRNSISWPRRIELDLWYIDNRCLALDVRILWMTVLMMLKGQGVRGEGGVNPEFPEPSPTSVPAPRSVTDVDEPGELDGPSARSDVGPGLAVDSSSRVT